ncbi:MAG: UDP-glucose--hexose-1-phosphate uridylyltransferase [Clostridia bacterium]|nr:UDP-glucose--hexose-1-phosphate uridylyltransferase [Clostridia bacterium]
MINTAVHLLVNYGIEKGLLSEEDRVYAQNRILALMQKDGLEPAASDGTELALHEILDILVNDAAARGLITDSPVYRDQFDTALMDCLMPRPSVVNAAFAMLREKDPEQATDWFYHLSKASNYIRVDRIARDVKWVIPSEYGEIDITINLSKPEKDPKAIAAAKLAKPSGYPKCQLCIESEGYAGRADFPARHNHRIIPLTLCGEAWRFQYSPYVYYNEHCIVLNAQHTPMKISRQTFARLLSFVEQFPHYFLGSNADLPIVGGSILTHDHFQGGHYTFAMAKAPIEIPVSFDGFDDIDAGIVQWPMATIRLTADNKDRIVELADKILVAWRGYSDPDAFIFAETEGTPHNTITPIARMADGKFQLDLVLRNNITTEEHPLGVYHPHAELHHIKKENIGLIEVMGLAVLPARLKAEMELLAGILQRGEDPASNEDTAKHAEWANEIKASRPEVATDAAMDVLKEEIGKVFVRVLEDAGVYKCTPEGRAAFVKFVKSV